MPTVTITVDTSQVQKLFAALAGRLHDMTPVMRNIGGIVVESVQRNFEEHRAPDGKKWAKLSSAYERWKVEKKGRNASDILILNRILMGSIHYKAEPTQVRVGTNIAYAAIHQFGGDIQRAARQHTLYFDHNQKAGTVSNRFVKKSKSNFAQDVTIGAHKITIKPRPFLGVRNEDWSEIQSAINKYLLMR